ncbi:Kinesin-like protein KIF13B [Durusdinium trenchii]|uniref:Kinesin-like protein KIF13B n=1 Tax=Durusdinium trenchii TaxID=1381693 RepID=A0ABP0RNL8_9DINO
MPMFNAQHMANMTWAMATLAHKDERYLHVLAERAMEEVARFNPQECSNLVWAFALLTFRDDALLQALSRRSQEIVADFIPQNLGNTAWAYNRLGYRDEQLMQCLVREAAGRLQDCAGQEVLDLIESIVTGGYEASVEGPEWQRLACWAGQKVEAVARCVVSSSEMPLTLRKLPDFDRALAVQDYQDHLASFSLVGLGFTYTCQILEQLGIRLLNGSEKEAWQKVAQEASNSISGTGNQSDVSKNVEAQEGLKICRTICVYRYALQLGPETVCVGPTAVTSGPARDAHELGLFAATLRHPRGGDGEFQALQACARASMQLGCEPTGLLAKGVEMEALLKSTRYFDGLCV